MGTNFLTHLIIQDTLSMDTGRREFIQKIALGISTATLPGITPAESKINVDQASENIDSTTADILVDRLVAWKVDIVFGLIGDGVNHIVEALRKQKNKIRLITVRHEEAAAFMASGYSKVTGKLGVCLATTGPGAVHLMNGIYDAAMEGASVVAITGSVYHDLIGTHFTQEVDTVSMMKDTAIFNRMITGPRHALTIVDLACRAALSTPGVAHLTISKDIQHKKLSDDKASNGSDNLIGSNSFVPRIDVPTKKELDLAADFINNGSRVMILAGRGALKAKGEVLELAQKIKAPVAKALLGKALLADDSPYTTGGTGHLGTLPSHDMMQSCDTLLILGSTMPHLEYYPKAGSAKVIQIDSDPRRLGLRTPIDLGITGDVKATLQNLLPLLTAKSDSQFLQTAQQKMSDWKQALKRLEEKPGSTAIKPQLLAATVGRLIAPDAIISIDTGAHTQFTARHLQVREDQQIIVCGNLASMGPGLPYAIASQAAYPGRQCIAMVGDGSFTMLMGEMATAVLYNLPIKVIVFKNNSLAMDRFEQEEMGNEKYGADLQPIDFVKVAEACGAEGYKISSKDDLEKILTKTLYVKAPAVIEVIVDPDEPPLPPEKIRI
jgi:pyruvate dehydrogenase (quinone)